MLPGAAAMGLNLRGLSRNLVIVSPTRKHSCHVTPSASANHALKSTVMAPLESRMISRDVSRFGAHSALGCASLSSFVHVMRRRRAFSHSTAALHRAAEFVAREQQPEPRRAGDDGRHHEKFGWQPQSASLPPSEGGRRDGPDDARAHPGRVARDDEPQFKPTTWCPMALDPNSNRPHFTRQRLRHSFAKCVVVDLRLCLAALLRLASRTTGRRERTPQSN